jgi:hypothetical protein
MEVFMRTLADIAIEYFCFLIHNRVIADPENTSTLAQAIPIYLDTMSTDERSAFSAAARRALDVATAEPDEHGYTPRKLVHPDHIAFLEAAASGRIFAAKSATQ